MMMLVQANKFIPLSLLTLLQLIFILLSPRSSSFAVGFATNLIAATSRGSLPASSHYTATNNHENGYIDNGDNHDKDRIDTINRSNENHNELFQRFVEFILLQQQSLIDQIERADGSNVSFSKDCWGSIGSNEKSPVGKIINESGGITRVFQRGKVVEKGACSLTILRNGKLTADRAKVIQGRRERINAGSSNQDEIVVQEGDEYEAAALSIVLHSRNPFVPTFRSDVRIFLVKSSKQENILAWFGGGSDLTPYYLIEEDIVHFHSQLKRVCDTHFPPSDTPVDIINNKHRVGYQQMKHSCDEYFYLPARSEHRGTGGIFFDDIPATPATLSFLQDVVHSWMPSYLPIVMKNKDKSYTHQQKHWQLLRRGRYLEFNLLYDRGVKFGLLQANPRVEGVMVSAPPLIAFDYNHVVEEGSDEKKLLEVLQKPRDWV